MENKRNIDSFLTQSYLDSWHDYDYSLKSEKAAHWDWVVITASNQRQAEAFQIQINKRKTENRLPHWTKFAVVSDPEGQRIGSGGATLNVIKYITENINPEEIITNLKIAIFHSGGDSKRIPQYSACGKLFSPVPNILPTGNRSTIFDELLIAISGIPARISSGILILPGDTEILYNPLQLDLFSCDAAALSIKANISEGKEHGVFLKDEDNNVSRFLHKRSEKMLKMVGAVNADNNVDIDTGCIWVGDKVVSALQSLISTNDQLDEEKCKRYINGEVCLSFYVDFIFPLASNVTLEEYLKETPEGVFSHALGVCREEIWKLLHGLKMALIQLTPARYIHFGTTQELFDLVVCYIEDYYHLGWKKRIFCNQEDENVGACNNCIIMPNAIVNTNSYIEDCYIDSDVLVGKNTIVSGLKLTDEVIPDNTVLHCLKLKNGKFVCRIYGIEDNPKASADGRFLNTTLHAIMDKYKLNNEDIWDEFPASIWNAHLYPMNDSMKEAIDSALKIWRIANNCENIGDVESWLSSKRISLMKSFDLADIKSILKWQEKIENLVRVEKCISLLMGNKEMSKALSVLDKGHNLETEVSMLIDRTMYAPDSLKMRIYLALSTLCKEKQISFFGYSVDDFENKAYEVISDGILSSMLERHQVEYQYKHFVSDEVIVNLPVRVNFCGSPSDAAPYCLEHGGTMLNAALLLRGKLPIHVVVKKIKEKIIKFESFDLKASNTYTDITDIRNCGNISDTFALHKAVLVATGVIPFRLENETLDDILEKLGGGIYMSTSVEVPKGSGLGTSSILAAACVKAVNQILNLNISDQCIYAQVFAVEQLLTTGGGWQDQVGGLTYGLKIISSRPGLYQDVKIDYINLDSKVMQELQNRFVLIFSGQRRLARNVLREEMNQCIRNNKVALEVMDRIQKLCVLMRFELERGDIKAFASYISEQFELVKKLDKGASNTCIEYIFDICDDLIDGKSICGAGGGGFLQVILKKGISKKQLEERLKTVFQDCGVEVWDSTFI